MSIFNKGSKDVNDEFEDGADIETGADLSAPFRGLDDRASRGKGALLAGVLALCASACGGYYVMSMGSGPVTPPVVAALEAPPSDPAVIPEQPAEQPAEVAATENTATDLPAPEAAEAPAPDTVVSETLVAESDTAVADTSAVVTPAEPVIVTGADAVPPADLPVPPGTAAADAAATAPETTPESVTEAVPATAAEMAIVENAPVLNELTQTPADGTTPEPAVAPGVADQNAAVDSMLGQDAMVRPLPKQYLIVKKNHEAGDVDSRLTAARRALAQGRYTAGLELFNELSREFPRDSRILMGRALALQKLGQADQALNAYEEVLNNDPKNLEALTNMLGLLKTQNPALSVEKLLELRDAYPYSADITAQLGISYAAQGAYEDGLKYLDMAEALKPGGADVLYNKAVLYDKMGNSQQAGELYRQILRMSAEGTLDQQLPIDAIRKRLTTLR